MQSERDTLLQQVREAKTMAVSASPSDRQTGLYNLWVLAANKTASKADIHAETLDSLALIVSELDPDRNTDDALQSCAGILSNLAAASKKMQNVIRRESGIEALIRVLAHEDSNSETKSKVAAALWRLAIDNEANQDHIVTHNGDRPLIDLLFNNGAVNANAAGALVLLSYRCHAKQDARIREYILQAGLLDKFKESPQDNIIKIAVNCSLLPLAAEELLSQIIKHDIKRIETAVMMNATNPEGLCQLQLKLSELNELIASEIGIKEAVSTGVSGSQTLFSFTAHEKMQTDEKLAL
jgi:hypothetical protein